MYGLPRISKLVTRKAPPIDFWVAMMASRTETAGVIISKSQDICPFGFFLFFLKQIF